MRIRGTCLPLPRGVFTYLLGLSRLHFHPPQLRAGSFSCQSPWETPNGNQQSTRNTEHSSPPVASCCGFWEAHPVVLRLPPCVVSVSCCCGCAPSSGGEAWGKGSSVGKKHGAAKCEDLPPVSAAQKCWSVFEELF